MATERPSVGLPVDAGGGQTIDPTKNVLDLVQAAVLRIDDLRNEVTKRLEGEISHMTFVDTLRADHARETAMRIENHSKEMRILESQRLDSIRNVDVLARDTAAARAADAIAALASTTQQNADNIRTAMTTTAQAIAKQNSDAAVALAAQTAALFQGVDTRLTGLERTSYEGKGRQALADPAMAELVGEMKALVRAQGEGAGKGQGVYLAWMVVIGLFTILSSVFSIFFNMKG